MTKLFIKNMVCGRCLMLVQGELAKMGLASSSIRLGEVVLDSTLNSDQYIELNKRLETYGFEIIDDKNAKIINQIKSHIIELIYDHDAQLKTNLSDHLSKHLLQDYHSLSHLFSEVEGNTIEKYFLNQKTERVKELIMYDELSLSEIAFKLNYSSVAHLSNQFKKITGLSPSHFKKLKDKKRQRLEEL